MKEFLRKNGLFMAALVLILVYLLMCSQYVVLTGSMEPTLDIGSVAVVMNGTKPEIGDICAYESGENIVIHRVIDITDDGKYVTKGDANLTADAVTVSPEKVRGKVILRINFIAPLLRFFAGL